MFKLLFQGFLSPRTASASLRVISTSKGVQECRRLIANIIKYQ